MRWLIGLAALALAGLGEAAAQTSLPWLRVCADPDDMPYSNAGEEGFENRILTVLARDLSAHITYEWRPRSRGFVQQTLLANSCDVVAGVIAGRDEVATTRPYYRSTYTFVSRTDRGYAVSSLDDPSLLRLRLATPDAADDRVSDPTRSALFRRGVRANITPLDPSARGGGWPPIIDALVREEIDMALIWGPTAGYFATRAPVRLTVSPITPWFDPPAWPMAFDIAMAVRPSDRRTLRALNGALARNREEIEVILRAYGVPLLDDPPPLQPPQGRRRTG